MKAFTLSFLFIALCLTIRSQQGQIIRFELIAQGQPFQLDKNYFMASLNDSVSISKLKFYISDISIAKHGKKEETLRQKHYLIDAENADSRIIYLDNKYSFDRISFNLGVDSLTNVGGVKGGDLDPIHGMYWTWQSGYINIKLEGYSPVCNTRNHFFQHHLGGYMLPYNCLQRINLNVDEDETEITILVDVLKYIESINISTTPEVMSPGTHAVSMAENFSKIFSFNHE